MSVQIRKVLVAGHEETRDSVYVEWRGRWCGKGPELWGVVSHMGFVWGKAGDWAYEPQPSSRTEEFIREFRWTDYDEAVKAAETAFRAPKP